MNNKVIKKMSVVTYFDGKKFRSKTEAKVAYIFKKLGIQYEYEEEYFEFSDGTKYLPDFYLPKYDQWVEVKGYMTDTDKAKIKMLEDEITASQTIIINEHLHTYYLDGTPVYLTPEGFTGDEVIYSEVIDAFKEAQSHNFEEEFDDLFTLVTDPYTRLFNLKRRYLQQPYYSLESGDDGPRIVNFCSDTRTIPYSYIGYDIVILPIQEGIDMFKLMLTKNEGAEVIYEFIVSEEQVKYSCTQIFRMAFDLYNHNFNYAEDRRIKLTDYLAA